MVVIRLARHGAKKRPFYQVVVADSRAPRDGAFLEKLGFFNPLTEANEQRLCLNLERMAYWKRCGAQMSERVQSLLKETQRQAAASQV